jgi:mannose-6-phosphate isomerase-like protein (cupin superfamily)
MLRTIALVLGLALVPQDHAPATHISASESAEKLKDSIARSVVDQMIKSTGIPGGQASVAMLYRTRAEASALIHERVTEIYYILEGGGTLVTGGGLQPPTKPTDLTRVGAGPSVSGGRQGGESRRMGPGDIAIIPAGTPHSFSQLDGPISYLVYRFDPAPAK